MFHHEREQWVELGTLRGVPWWGSDHHSTRPKRSTIWGSSRMKVMKMLLIDYARQVRERDSKNMKFRMTVLGEGDHS